MILEEVAELFDRRQAVEDAFVQIIQKRYPDHLGERLWWRPALPDNSATGQLKRHIDRFVAEYVAEKEAKKIMKPKTK